MLRQQADDRDRVVSSQYQLPRMQRLTFEARRRSVNVHGATRESHKANLINRQLNSARISNTHLACTGRCYFKREGTRPVKRRNEHTYRV